jgi:hypothetical protein
MAEQDLTHISTLCEFLMDTVTSEFKMLGHNQMERAITSWLAHTTLYSGTMSERHVTK